MPFLKRKSSSGETYYTHKGRRYTAKQVRAYYATNGFRRKTRRKGKKR